MLRSRIIPTIIQDIENIILDYLLPKSERRNLVNIIGTDNLLLFQILSKEEKTKLSVHCHHNDGMTDEFQAFHGLNQDNCKCMATYYASLKGYLHVIKWLNQNHKKICTIWGMEYAARNGHLDVVKFLYTNGKCRWKLSNGYMKIVKKDSVILH